MKKLVIGTVAATALAAGLAAPAQAENFRIGFLNTLSGGAAILGKAQLAGWQLGLELEGWKKNGDKLGGVPTDVFVGDDQRKVDVGLRAVRKWLKSERVHMVAGVIWSNILAAVQRPVIRGRRIMMSTNAGWSGMAGKNCSPYFISSSFQNDENAEAMGALLNLEGLKKVFMMAPNYQAGKDMLNGFQRTYKDGKVVGQILFKLGTRDFQAEISKVRASGADSLFIFVPGGMGIAFMKQWAASGAGQTVKLYTNYAVDYITIKPIGKAAVGTFHTLHWGPNIDNPRNAEFIKAFMAKNKRIPDMFALQAYDGARKVADGLRGVKGNFKNLKNLVKTMRAQGLNSVRGQLKYNVNGFLIQPWYKRSVVLDAKGVPQIQVNQMVSFRPDSFGNKCPKKSWN
ncbi:MAG: ABC transporter substrate-binding protein [Rhodospirillaceae bacterium]|nr:ABC transporter substrate-binding protein [Rhodospirillaceae bacterium]MDE0618060.1 ABC transporter substrate-binding protein [Rhodospirillaceae bacterium]MDE0717440.1 ABC transporter substrate-binding protein [Rhodospirillaceae bacterium]